MARKALLIGAQTGGLTGVDNDIKAMAGALRLWEFTCLLCEAENASRAGILEAYKQLIEDAEPDDTVFVYYSGHGGYCRQPDYETVVRPRAALQFIVPTDFDQSKEGDFRGITSFELSQLQAKLTDRTKNVVTALDCCHSSQMSKDLHVRVRSISRPAPYAIVSAHLDALQRRGFSLERWSPGGNEHAVRLVACAPEQYSYEYDNAAGERNGMFTEALVAVLTEAASSPRITWDTLIERVREQVLLLAPTQRPEAEGPSRRILFETVEDDSPFSLPVIDLGGGRVRLEGAPLLGVNIGDELAIMRAESLAVDDATKIGDVRVVERDAMAAYGSLKLRSDHLSLPLDARAYRTRAVASRLPVRVSGDDAQAVNLLRAMTASSLVRPAEPEEKTQYEVAVDLAGGLTVNDHVGALHAVPRQPDEAGIRRVVKDLERLWRANALRALTDESDEAAKVPLTVEFGVVEDGLEKPLRHSGEVVHIKQNIFIRLRNNGDLPLYASLLDIGLAAEITLLNRFAPSGVRLDPGKEYVFGWNQRTGELAGLPLSWPPSVPAEQPRAETILALVATAPHDAHVYEQRGIRRDGGIARSRLQDLLDHIRTGADKEVGVDAGPVVPYTVRAIDFDLMPVFAPHTENVPFEVDERPDRSVVLYARRGTGQTNLAVRLSDLIVHHNRALRSADIRLDTIVLTGLKGPDGRPVFHAQTERFHNIHDGQPLPLDRLLVYHGPVVDYLDIAVWVTRDSRDSLELSDLLRERLTSAEMQGALAQLGGMLVTTPQAAMAVAAVGASAVVINIAYRLLQRVVGDSIGLYRTTLLAHERFGTDRNADQNLVRAQDFSFTYTVESVD